MLFVLTLDHIENAFICFFILYCHGKLDLSLFMAGPKSRLEATRFVRIRCTHLWPKLPRKVIEPRVLETMVCLIADAFALVSNCYHK